MRAGSQPRWHARLRPSVRLVSDARIHSSPCTLVLTPPRSTRGHRPHRRRLHDTILYSSARRTRHKAKPHGPHPTDPLPRNPNACRCLSLAACAQVAPCIIVDHFCVLIRLSAARCITRRRRHRTPCTSAKIVLAATPVCRMHGCRVRRALTAMHLCEDASTLHLATVM